MEEEESGGVAIGIEKLTIETAVTEEEAAEYLKAALGMEVDEEVKGKGEEGGVGTPRALEAL